MGVKSAAIIEDWQKRAHFSEEVEWVSEMIQEDAKRCLELDEKIKRLEAKIEEVAKVSKIAKILLSIPGFGAVCTSELAGEIGTIERFASEGSLSLYLRHVHVGQQFGELSRNQSTEARQHASQSSDDGRSWIVIENMSPSRRATTRRNEAKEKSTTRRFELWGATSAGSFISCSKKNASMRFGLKKGIPSQGQSEIVALKRKYGGRKFQRKA